MYNDNSEKDNMEYKQGYKKAIDDVLYSVLSYIPKSENYHDKCTMQRCRDDIAQKISMVSKTKKK